MNRGHLSHLDPKAQSGPSKIMTSIASVGSISDQAAWLERWKLQASQNEGVVPKLTTD